MERLISDITKMGCRHGYFLVIYCNEKLAKEIYESRLPVVTKILELPDNQYNMIWEPSYTNQYT